MNDELLSILQADQVDQGELGMLLLETFHGAMQVSPTEFVYPKDGEECALRCIFTNSKLVSVRRGPKLTPDDLKEASNRIQSHLIASKETRVAHSVLFSSIPVKGWFRYRDIFQISPVPPGAPQLHSLLGSHPFILQFQYNPSSSISIDQSRRQMMSKRIELLLCGFLEGHIGGIGGAARFCWVLPSDQAIGQARSVFAQEIYTFPELGRLGGQEFSDLDPSEAMAAVEAQEYLSMRGIYPGRGLQVPSYLTMLLENFFQRLTDKDQDRFLRACFWFSTAASMRQYSSSASFIGLISAIEALMPDPSPGVPCLTCSRPQGKGATRLLKEFVEEFAGAAPQREVTKRGLYAIRSKLSHGGALLHSDTQGFLIGLDPRHTREWGDFAVAEQLVRILIVNWLGRYGNQGAEGKFSRA
jgi:hypothetical protein